MATGIIVDVETTGLDPKTCEIIEIGILKFQYEDETPRITSMFGALQKPSQPLPKEIIQITGITDADLEGQTIDWDYIATWFEGADMVVAHNAEFDKAFLMKQPELKEFTTPWACTKQHIPWKKLGFRTRALNYLAADQGFVNPFAHRALFDCATTFRVMEPYFGELLSRYKEPVIRLEARGAAFATKDLLKKRGYRWDPENKVWFTEALGCDLSAEQEFLEAEIYAGPSQAREVVLAG